MKLSAAETLGLIRAGREGNTTPALEQVQSIRQLTQRFALHDDGKDPDHRSVAICQDIYDQCCIDSDTDELATGALLQIDGMLALGSL